MIINKKILIIIGIFLIAFSGFVYTENLSNNSSQFTNEQNTEIESNVFYEMSASEFIDDLESDSDGIYYLGFPDCPWCKELKPIIEDVAKKYGITVNYVQTRDENRNLLYTEEQKEKIISYLGDYLETDDEGNKVIYVPMVINLKNGNVVSSHIGTVDGHDAHERTMTEDEIKQCEETIEKIFLLEK